MALMANFTLRNGVTVNGVYLKIDILRGDKNNLGFNLVPYIDRNAASRKEPLEEGYYFEFTPSTNDDSPRWDKQAYEYLLTREEFVDAIIIKEE
jgi:hypothetical protein